MLWFWLFYYHHITPGKITAMGENERKIVYALMNQELRLREKAAEKARKEAENV